MKKILIVSFFIITFLSINESVFAFDFNLKNLNPLNKKETKTIESNYIVVESNDTAQIIKFKDDGKYGLLDTKTNKYIFNPIADKIVRMNNTDKLEYKITLNGHTGYMNLDEHYNIFADYDDIYKVDELLKVKRSGQYGLIDKKGNIILDIKYDKLFLTSNSNGDKHIAAKLGGKYLLYTLDGKLVPESELYLVSSSDKLEQAQYMLARDLRPELRVNKRFNLIVHEKIAADDLDKSNEEVFEIQKLKVPGTVRTSETKNQLNKNENDKVSEYNKQNVNKLVPANQVLSLNGKKYYIVYENSFVGLKNDKDKLIIPIEYIYLGAKEFKKQTVFKASNKDSIMYFSENGDVMAMQSMYSPGVIYIFNGNKTYKYTYKDNSEWLLSYKNKEIGTLTLTKDTSKFERKAFVFANISKINNILKLCLGID